MRKLWSLIKVGLITNFAINNMRYRLFTQKKDRWLALVAAWAMVSFIPMFYLYFRLVQTLYGWLAPIGQQQLILTLTVLIGQLFILFFGGYYVLSVLYFANDLPLLIPLPFKPFHVMLSKFAVILANEYVAELPLVLPALIFYGIVDHAGISYWLATPLVYLLIPIIPLALITAVVMAMMRAVNLSRKKDAFVIIGSLMMLAVMMTVMRFANSSVTVDQSKIMQMLTAEDGLVAAVGAKFPPSVWVTRFLAHPATWGGLLNLTQLLTVSAVLFCCMIVVAQKHFYRGLIGAGEVSSRTKRLTDGKVSGLASAGYHPIRAIFIREVRIMNRTPIFLLNGVLVIIIVPFIFLFMMPASAGPAQMPLLKLMASNNPLVMTLAAACFFLFCGCLNGSASSSISREGRQFWLSKVIPVPYYCQVVGKFLHCYLIALLGILLAAAMTAWRLKLPAPEAILAGFLAALTAFALTALGMIIDLSRPLLEWSNPQKAIKQNLNVLLGLLVNIAVVAGLGFLSSALFHAGAASSLVIGVLVLVLTALAVGSFTFLLKLAGIRYPAIEA